MPSTKVLVNYSAHEVMDPRGQSITVTLLDQNNSQVHSYTYIHRKILTSHQKRFSLHLIETIIKTTGHNGEINGTRKCSVSINTSTIPPPLLNHREHWRKGGRERQEPVDEKTCEILSARHARKASPMKPQQYGCLNKTRKNKDSTNRYMNAEGSNLMRPQTRNCRQLILTNTQKGKLSLPHDEFSNWLSNTK